MTTCRYCQRRIVKDEEGVWVDPLATGDDSVWRETCDMHDTFIANHSPDWVNARGDEGQDRESYTDTQDRDSYTVSS